jgi:hypothetical protein
MKMQFQVFWVVTPRSVVVGYQTFAESCCLRLPEPFTSPGSLRQQDPENCWCPTTTLHSLTTQNTLTSLFVLCSVLSETVYYLTFRNILRHAWIHSVPKLLSSCLLSKKKKIKIYKIIILSFVLYECETCYLTVREEHVDGIWGQDAEENICT